MLNAHVVINMYRPHQARESVREMLVERLEEGKREIEEIGAKKKEVEEYLQEVTTWKQVRKGREDDGRSNSVNGDGKAGDEASREEKEIEQAKRLWRIVHEIADE